MRVTPLGICAHVRLSRKSPNRTSASPIAAAGLRCRVMVMIREFGTDRGNSATRCEPSSPDAPVTTIVSSACPLVMFVDLNHAKAHSCLAARLHVEVTQNAQHAHPHQHSILAQKSCRYGGRRRIRPLSCIRNCVLSCR